MGIDAEICIKVNFKPTNEQLKQWSWDICNSLGAKNFFLDRLKGQGAFSLATDYNEEHEDGKVWRQDGEPVIAGKDEFFIRTNLWTRYYGIGYERGDLPLIINVAEWVERNIPNSQVFYGGDSSGCVIEPFDKAAREVLLNHFLGPKGRDYFNYDRRSTLGSESWTNPPRADCKLCLGPANRFGWGAQYAAFICPGCGEYFTTRDTGQTWQLGEKESRL